jgi:23S rRNA pseudouridine1911/1915/1917 synthase
MVKPSTQYKREHKADYGHEKIEILYEDQYLTVINKPTGMLSVPYPGSRARTAIAVLEQLMRENGTYSTRHHPFCVHRLDRDTSGVMMFAMTETAQKKIMDTWHRMVTGRLYRAVAENNGKKILPEEGIIDAPLAYNAYNIGFVLQPGDRPGKTAHKKPGDTSVYERHLDFENGSVRFKTVPARTHFKVLFRGATHTLFELNLDTGRKNQIRAHLAANGYPLAGDENYRAHTDPFGRLALHARTLEFDHPFTNKHLKFEIPEPEEWLSYVKKGDFHPARPLWAPETKKTAVPHSYANKKRDNRIQKAGNTEKTTGRKKRNSMDFIEKGRLRNRS